ncbi:MAG: 2-C-methyl-D-erythritol 4-phosphate cytidylyltransferase [candidate division NC10 bacterium]|nr:2-C-methyl-D-erythritol 4-phosphate cytidylyltransferase [candidate division NC10 bacterium]MCZ6552077.1 2-C-methyl-D-erythritol 4-phosphate cytidylyltransferase [candidate division NC10 bacterium]
MNVTAIVPAAGLGRRAGGDVPKQFLLLRGMPILTRTLLNLTNPGLVNALVLVVPPGAEEWCQQHILAPYPLPPIIEIIPGGAERQESVFRGLQRTTAETQLVVIHDAVRPFVSPDLLRRTIEAAQTFRAAVAAVPAVETVKVVERELIRETPPRDRLWIAQTPQAFEGELIREAYRRAAADGFRGTDDAMLVERLGVQVKVVLSYPENMKITTAEDLQRAEQLLSRWEDAGCGSASATTSIP